MRWARRSRNPKRPLVAIVAGSKVSTKLTILAALAKKVDRLIVGGGIAEHLPAGRRAARSANRWPKRDLVGRGARNHRLMARGAHVPLPDDVVVRRANCRRARASP